MKEVGCCFESAWAWRQGRPASWESGPEKGGFVARAAQPAALGYIKSMAKSGEPAEYSGDQLSTNDFEESEIDCMLALTPQERLRIHDGFLELVRTLREAGIKYYGRDPRPPEEVD